MLHEKGIVDDEQYTRLQQEIDNSNLKKLAEAEAQAKAMEPEYEINLDSGIKVSSRDKQFAMKIGGRIQADGAWYGEDDSQFGSGSEIRRARIYLQGTFYQDWKYKLQYDFVDSGTDGIRDAYLAYTGLEGVKFIAGQSKTPFSVESQNSSKHILFTERSLASALSPGRRLGFAVGSFHQQWTAVAGVFGDNADTEGGDEDEGWGFNGRATYAPFYEEGKFWMLGASGEYRHLGGEQRLRYKTQPETHIAGVNLVDTGIMTDVDHYWTVGVESTAVYGPFSTQAEYHRSMVDRSNHNSPDFSGWYVQAGYFLTGESRQYKNGKLKNIKPRTNFGNNGWGAWEVGLRFSSLDLNSAGVNGGRERNFTAENGVRSIFYVFSIIL